MLVLVFLVEWGLSPGSVSTDALPQSPSPQPSTILLSVHTLFTHLPIGEHSGYAQLSAVVIDTLNMAVQLSIALTLGIHLEVEYLDYIVIV